MTVMDAYWTDPRIQRLKDLNGEKLWSASQMAHMLGQGCTRNMVIGKLRRLDLNLLPPNTPRVSEPRRPRAPKAPRRLPPAPKPPPLPAAQVTELPPEPPSSTWVRFADLGPIKSRTHCRWPVAGQPGPDMMCCGAEREENAPYCEFHSIRARGR